MHLKSLTLRGFKSFASATTLRFEPGITCVVGPNGSGKSNVVDALSWVMGEQGAKSLRGGKMEDVIFAGTTGRSPLGRAEVSLTIDNSDGALPIDYAEVTITRTMFRNGGSEYRINGNTCRLLDIQELLSDSGIGREMHVIVGQGQLDSVLHADPAGRRAFIEEAAGVLKHRKRKEKALRKLDAMQANLARVQDLTDELRRQLKPLGRQAAAARRAAVVQADLRDARLRLLADDLVTQRSSLQEDTDDDVQLRARKSEAEERLRVSARREAALEQEVRTLTPRLRRAQEAWQELSQLAERVRGTVSLADARVAAATSHPPEERPGRDPEELEREATRLREQEAELRAALEAASSALESAGETRADLEAQLATEERRLRDLDRARSDRREHLARLQGRAAAAAHRADAARSEIERLTTERDGAAQRAGEAEQRHAALRSRSDGQEAEETEFASRHDAARADLAAAEDRLAAARDARSEVGSRRAAVVARRDALGLGLRRKDGSGAILDAAGALTGVLGTSADLLTVAPGYEVPVAAALGAAADAVAVAGPPTAVEALRLLRKNDAGRVVLLLAGAAGPPERGRPPADGAEAVPADGEGTAGRGTPDGAVRAAELVTGPADLMPAVRHLLRDVVVVAGLEEAERLLHRAPGAIAVTTEGDVVSRHLASGGSSGNPSRLELQAAVDEAAEELARIAAEGETAVAALAAAERIRAEAADRVEQLGAGRRAADRQRSALAQELGRLAGESRALAEEAERADRAVARSHDAAERAAVEAAELMEQLAAAEENGDDDEPDRLVRDRLEAEGSRARQAEMEARLAVRTHEERVRGLTGRADGLARAAVAEREARGRAARRRERLHHEAHIGSAVAAGARTLLAHVEASLDRSAAERDAADGARTERAAAVEAERQAARGLKEELDRLTDSVHRGEVLGAEKRLRIEQLESRAMEELGVDPDALVAEYGPDQPVLPSPLPDGEAEPSGGRAPVPYDRAEQERRLRAAERAYKQLGKVNPLALEEFAALEERHQFLGEQLEDLRKTRADLLQVVKEVDERVEQVFTAAYHDTARQFEGVFARLFPGGEGRLVLTDPENMLTTGVDVEARPPGKRVKRLSLLSGGERSLTAVALLVSIFKARPSPFYVMDEVEAALDDTNLQRLIRIMTELRESSQLIVITHQKRTMEVADALYGVSMQGDGVSKVISQRLG
ncbi:chromosome segregation protein SMC [Streptomyces lonarensis]|uniref:Chromosome partition protein Smc n=1 Tax=Streptomyces lonarensis TaxID=700599 RepID=A0A7X6HXP9_9ACTN|nr:chromosome segregation protein SMC [Streptomyces lonarensis]NJQ04545.1 chromosome segregation protein SMC [Streptomyces lonarensis]